MTINADFHCDSCQSLKASADSESERGIGTASALIFDDEPQVCEVVAENLEHMGILAQCATTMMDFKCQLAACSPDLIVLDLSLGDTDAVRAFELLQSSKYSGRVVLISGKYPAALDHAKRVGERFGLTIGGILQKPFFQAEFRKSILNALAVPLADDKLILPDSSRWCLNEILRENWLEFWGQPKVDLKTGHTVGIEVLARARHPKIGIIGPDLFLKGAADHALAEVSRRALDQTLAMIGDSEHQRSLLSVSINLAYSTLSDPLLLDELCKIRERHAFSGSIILEITETDVGENASAEAFATRAVLHDFKVSIDDFGHGFATFDRLRTIPFSELKLERSIVDGCATDAALQKLCGAVAQLAHDFGATAVAEGVENPEDFSMVTALGFDLAQGYLFSRPRSLRDLMTDPVPRPLHGKVSLTAS